MQSTPVSTKHLGYLDGWRALAATWVVLHHAWCLVGDRLTGIAGEVLKVLDHGRAAVDLFIVLSGFCLMLPVIKDGGVLRGGTIEFLKRRAWRILPPYYCAMAFSLLLIDLCLDQRTGTLWDNALPTTLKSIGAHLLLIHDAFAGAYDNKINYVFWSIAVEWRIYFFFPLLVLGWRYLGPFKTFLLGFVASAILYRLSYHLISSTLTLNYLGLFVGGMLAAAIAFSTTDSLDRWRKLPWGWITLLLSCVVVELYRTASVSSQIRDYGVGLWAMSAVVATSVGTNAWHHKILGSRPLAFVGTFAYSIYLIHAPLLQLLWQYPFASLHPYPWLLLAALMLSVPAILGVSYLFFLLFERPFLRRRKKAAIAPAPVLSAAMKLEESGSTPV